MIGCHLLIEWSCQVAFGGVACHLAGIYAHGKVTCIFICRNVPIITSFLDFRLIGEGFSCHIRSCLIAAYFSKLRWLLT